MPPEFRMSVLPDGHPVARPAGDLDLATVPSLENLLDCAAQHSEYIVVDMSSVAFMDCSALKVLLRAHHAARSRGGAVVLVEVACFFRHLLALTQVQGELAVYESIDDALAAWQHQAEPGERHDAPSTQPNRDAHVGPRRDHRDEARL